MSSCPICAHRVEAPFVEIEGVPVHVSLLHRTPAGARAAVRGDLRLAFCEACAFIWNAAYDPGMVEYDADYENSLDHSPAFAEHVAGLAERLVDRYDLRGKRVVEVGCGQADFLRRLAEAGGNEGIGYDPSHVGPERDGRVTVHHDLYSETTVGEAEPDFVACRHVLEHVEQPLEFVRSLRRTLDADRGTPVYFEVPNGEHQLANDVVWDIIYAHFSTFTGPSLRTLFELGGFEVLDCGTAFGGQYLWIEARPAVVPARTDRRDEVALIRTLALAFGARYHALVRRWNETVASYGQRGRRVVLWGAGAKGVTLLNALDDGSRIGRVVDVNPRKHGSYVPGAGTPVVRPESLREYGPDVVVLANPIYRDEVGGILARLGQEAELVCV